MSDSLAYDSGRAVLLGVDGRWDDEEAKFMVLLAKATYQPDESHETVADVGKHELTGGGYQRQALTGRALRKNPDTHRVEFVAEPAVFSKPGRTRGAAPPSSAPSTWEGSPSAASPATACGGTARPGPRPSSACTR